MQDRTKALWTFAITSVALFMVMLDNLVVSTALPVIRTDLGATIEPLEWTVNAYTLTFAVLLLTGAALGDRFGRRRMFVIGLAIFTAASAAAALAPSIEALIAARAVQGVGGAIVMPLTLTLLSAAFPSERRGLALGAWAGIGGLAVAFGPLVGGAVVDGISWQWIFWLNVPIGLVLLPLALVRLARATGPTRRLDLPGPRARERRPARPRLGSRERQLRRLDEPADRRRRSPPASLLLAAFVAWERARPAPMLPSAFFRSRAFAAANGASLVDVLRDVRLDLPARAVPPDRAGLLAARGGAAMLPVDGDADARRADRRSALRPDRRAAADGRGLALQAIGLAWLAAVLSASTSPTRSSSCPSSSPGSAWGSSSRPVANVVLSRSARGGGQGVRRRRTRSARSAASSASRCSPSVFARSGGYESPAVFTDGLVPATWVGAAIVGVGALIALFVPGKQRAEARVGRLEAA